MNAIEEIGLDRSRRLVNQREFPLSFVVCPCDGGCLFCAYTGRVSRAERKQMGQRDPAGSRAGDLA